MLTRLGVVIVRFEVTAEARGRSGGAALCLHDRSVEDLGPGVLKLTRVAIAFAFTAGVAGRWILLRRAEHSATINDTFLLSEAAAPFDRIVILSSMLILPAGLATASAQGFPWLGLTAGWMSVSVVIYVALSALVPTVFVPRGNVFAAALRN